MGRKWNNIKNQKASKDANRSKIYAKFGLEIYAAAKPEPDITLNRNLQMVVEKAKTYNVPRDIIERNIEKAKGNTDDFFQQLRYEGYGPGGSAVIVDTLTNNVNRTVSEVRATFSKNHGTLGVSGSVTFMFDSVSIVGAIGVEMDALLEALIEHDCDVIDIEESEEGLLVYGKMEDFSKIQEAFRSLGVTSFTTSEVSMLPQNEVTLEGEKLEQFTKLIDTLDDLEDVMNVYHNVAIEEE